MTLPVNRASSSGLYRSSVMHPVPPHTAKKRKKTDIACAHCFKAKAGCDMNRPCGRCVRLDKKHCVNRVYEKREQRLSRIETEAEPQRRKPAGQTDLRILPGFLQHPPRDVQNMPDSRAPVSPQDQHTLTPNGSSSSKKKRGDSPPLEDIKSPQKLSFNLKRTKKQSTKKSVPTPLNLKDICPPATAHKVEVNAPFHEDDVLQNTIRATQKMFTPQLYDQLRPPPLPPQSSPNKPNEYNQEIGDTTNKTPQKKRKQKHDSTELERENEQLKKACLDKDSKIKYLLLNIQQLEQDNGQLMNLYNIKNCEAKFYHEQYNIISWFKHQGNTFWP